LSSRAAPAKLPAAMTRENTRMECRRSKGGPRLVGSIAADYSVFSNGRIESHPLC
jgi:hypothetical protein